MQMLRQRPLWRTDSGSAVLAYISVIRGIEKFFDLSHGHLDLDPVLGGSILNLLGQDTMCIEPFVYSIGCFLGRLDEVGDFFSGQMLTILAMLWI